MSASIARCPVVELVKLPTDAVITFDGIKIKRGLLVYYRFAPGPHASEYVVVSDRAIRNNGETEIVVMGRRAIVSGMNPLDMVSDVARWEEFLSKRNPR